MKNYMTLNIKFYDAFYIKMAILEQIKFYGGCAKAFKKSYWLDEKERNDEFLDCVNKVKMFFWYYKEISKRLKE